MAAAASVTASAGVAVVQCGKGGRRGQVRADQCGHVREIAQGSIPGPSGEARPLSLTLARSLFLFLSSSHSLFPFFFFSYSLLLPPSLPFSLSFSFSRLYLSHAHFNPSSLVPLSTAALVTVSRLLTTRLSRSLSLSLSFSLSRS